MRRPVIRPFSSVSSISTAGSPVAIFVPRFPVGHQEPRMSGVMRVGLVVRRVFFMPA